MSTQEKDALKELPGAVNQPDLRVYYLGIGAVGLTIGIFAGLSNSPVVAVLLPLMFGLIGGAGGLYLGVADPGDRLTAVETLQGTRTRAMTASICRRVAASAQKALDRLGDPLLDSLRDGQGDALRRIAETLGRLRSEYSNYAGKIEAGGWIPITAVAARLEIDRDRFSNSLHDEGMTPALSGREAIRADLMDVELRLIEEHARTAVGWRADSRLAEAMNEFFKSTGGGKEASAPIRLAPSVAH